MDGQQRCMQDEKEEEEEFFSGIIYGKVPVVWFL